MTRRGRHRGVDDRQLDLPTPRSLGLGCICHFHPEIRNFPGTGLSPLPDTTSNQTLRLKFQI